MAKRVLIVILLLVIFLTPGKSQIKNIGVPYIRNYPKREYKAGTQSWGIAQDQKGFMYFANNEGLLEFDGVAWHLTKMPNSSLTRSVYVSENGDIFVGAYNELGKMEYGINGKLEYKSLKKYIPAEFQNFDDI